MQLLCQPFALGLEAVDVALGQSAVGVGLQSGELRLAFTLAPPLPLHVQSDGQRASQHYQGGHGQHHARLRQVGFAARQGQLLLLGLVFHGQRAQAFGLVGLEEAVLQFHGLAEAQVSLVPVAKLRPRLVHVVVTVVHHERHAADALQLEDFVHQSDGPAPPLVVHLHAGEDLVVGHERHRVVHFADKAGASAAPQALALGVARAVGHGHHVGRRAQGGVVLPGLHGHAVAG